MPEPKNLERSITDAWQRQSWWLWLMLPLMFLYWLGSSIHKACYKFGLKKTYKAKVPVLVVGNITVGGSGKTPLLIALVKLIQSYGVAVAVISRGYGANDSHARMVKDSSTPAEVGDEPCLIKQATDVVMAVGRQRSASIELILKNHPTTQLILCDDGLQHYQLHHDMAWIVNDVKRGLGNAMLLPVGFLREWGSRLKYPLPKDIIVNHVVDLSAKQGDYYFYLQPQALYNLGDKLITFSHQKTHIHAVTGIGYPKRFFNTLITLGFTIEEHAFPDHHPYTLQDISFGDTKDIIITEKDAVKLANLALPKELIERIWVLPVAAVISEGCKHTLKQQLKAQSILVKNQ